MVRVKESIVTIYTWTNSTVPKSRPHGHLRYITFLEEKNQSVKGLEFWKPYQHTEDIQVVKAVYVHLAVQYRQGQHKLTPKGQQMTSEGLFPPFHTAGIVIKMQIQTQYKKPTTELLNNREATSPRALWIPFMGTVVCFLQ